MYTVNTATSHTCTVNIILLQHLECHNITLQGGGGGAHAKAIRKLPPAEGTRVFTAHYYTCTTPSQILEMPRTHHASAQGQTMGCTCGGPSRALTGTAAGRSLSIKMLSAVGGTGEYHRLMDQPVRLMDQPVRLVG